MKFAKTLLGMSVAAALAMSSSLAVAQAGETVKIAVIDPFSGPSANLGLNILHTLQLLAERDAKAGAVKFEILPFDNKGSGPETLNALKAAVDQGIRYV